MGNEDFGTDTSALKNKKNAKKGREKIKTEITAVFNRPHDPFVAW
jgi:hypothetical protein